MAASAAVTSEGWVRETRAVVFALVCVGLSAALHSALAGMVVSPLAFLAGLALVWSVAFGLARRERGYWFIVAAMLLSQAGLHVLFTVLSVAGAHGEMPAMGPLAGQSAGWLAGGPLMVVAHVAAGLAAAGWLRGGEEAVTGLRRWLGLSLAWLRVLLTLSGRVVPADRPTHPVFSRGPEGRAALWWCHGVVRRGPPAFT